MFVRQSAWKNSAPTEWIFMKFDIWVFFRKSVEQIQVSLKSDKNNGHFPWRPINIFYQFYLECEMFQTKVVEKIKTHILCSITIVRNSCRLWDDVKSMVEPDTAHRYINNTAQKRNTLHAW